MSENTPSQDSAAAPEAAQSAAPEQDLAAQLAELQAKNAELADLYLRAQADVQNARRRADEEIAKSRKFAAYVVYESADKSAKWSQFFADKALADRMRARGHKFRVADQDVKTADGRTPADVAPWIERAKKAGVEECYFDRGGFLFHGKIKALADAAREGRRGCSEH